MQVAYMWHSPNNVWNYGSWSGFLKIKINKNLIRNKNTLYKILSVGPILTPLNYKPLLQISKRVGKS
jgi:hypothetical protein